MSEQDNLPSGVKSFGIICAKCNKEFFPDLGFVYLYQARDACSVGVNFLKCPNCGERQDVWIRMMTRDSEDKTEIATLKAKVAEMEISESAMNNLAAKLTEAEADRDRLKQLLKDHEACEDDVCCHVTERDEALGKLESAVGILREMDEWLHDGLRRTTSDKTYLIVSDRLRSKCTEAGISLEAPGEKERCRECALSVNGYEDEICRGCEDGAHFTPRRDTPPKQDSALAAPYDRDDPKGKMLPDDCYGEQDSAGDDPEEKDDAKLYPCNDCKAYSEWFAQEEEAERDRKKAEKPAEPNNG